MGVLLFLAMLVLLSWSGLTFYFTRRFNRSEPSRLQRFGNMIIAGFAAGIIIFGITCAVLLAVCSGMTHI